MQSYELLRNRRPQKSNEDQIIYFLLENGLQRYLYTDEKRKYNYLKPMLEVTSKQGKDGIHGSIMYPVINVVPGNVEVQNGGSSWINISGDLFRDYDEYLLTRSVGSFLPEDYYDGNNLGKELAKSSIVFYLSMMFGSVPNIAETLQMSSDEIKKRYPKLIGANIGEVKSMLKRLKKCNIEETFDVVVIGEESVSTPTSINLMRHTKLPFFSGSISIEGDNGEMPNVIVNEEFAEYIFKNITPDIIYREETTFSDYSNSYKKVRKSCITRRS